MGCLDCSAIHLSGKTLTCQQHLSVDMQNIWNPEDCERGKRENNYFGKTYGMKQMILIVLSEIGLSLSKEEKDLIKQQDTVTNQVLFTIDLYEKKIESLGIEKPEAKDLKQGKSCYHCIHSSASEDNLFVQCGYYHNDIGEELQSCEPLHKEWEKSDQMIRKIGLNHFFDLVLQYNSSLWLYVNEDTTAGDKWVAILHAYEKTIREKTYRVQKLNRTQKSKELSVKQMIERVQKKKEPTKQKEALEDGIVY